ncbi:MAG TPA: hypothetical protein PK769_09370, partial [Flavobacteriaceae bacterium]|nr:hypothetical protein [Flavobacteriaceae bacterium]
MKNIKLEQLLLMGCTALYRTSTAFIPPLVRLCTAFDTALVRSKDCFMFFFALPEIVLNFLLPVQKKVAKKK